MYRFQNNNEDLFCHECSFDCMGKNMTQNQGKQICEILKLQLKLIIDEWEFYAKQNTTLTVIKCVMT